MDLSFSTISEAKLGWGVTLLIASLRRAGLQNRVEIFSTDEAPELERSLAQFGNVKMHLLDTSKDPRNPCLRKPETLLALETEYIGWFDNDCMIIGDIGKYYMPLNGEFQIRMRGLEENAWVFERYYEPGEKRGPTPQKILKDWQADVGERTEPRVLTKCLANSFILHRKHRAFLEHWQRQNDKIFPKERSVGVVDRNRPAYFITDESVLSSILAFANEIPPISEYRFDKDPKNYVAHFALRPKPWERWQWRLWKYYDEVQSVLRWCEEQKIVLPPLPPSFQRRKKLLYGLMSFSENKARFVARKVRGRK